MHKESFEPPASAFRQEPSSQFIGRGVTLVMAAGFVVANIYYSRPSRQVGHPVRPRRARSRERSFILAVALASLQEISGKPDRCCDMQNDPAS